MKAWLYDDLSLQLLMVGGRHRCQYTRFERGSGVGASTFGRKTRAAQYVVY